MKKAWYQSLTIWSLIFLFIGAVIGAIQDGGVAAAWTDPTVGNVLALLLQAVGWGGAVAGRAQASQPVRLPGGLLGTRGSAQLFAVGMLGLGAFVAMSVLALVFGPGCATPQRCPDGQGVQVSYVQGPPSSLAARCSGDPRTVTRRSLEAPGAGTFEVVCPDGALPGARPGTARAIPCGGHTCATAELACVPSASHRARDTTDEQPDRSASGDADAGPALEAASPRGTGT